MSAGGSGVPLESLQKDIEASSVSEPVHSFHEVPLVGLTALVL